jgi:CheY-like chemotaxis protein
MNADKIRILLADDDKDDRFLFKEALKELSFSTNLETVHDGEQLMKYLSEHENDLPNVLFLDLNMPKINGFECLTEIKANNKLNSLPVIMFSTSYPRDIHYEEDMIKMLYKIGAQDYIRKPTDFSELKRIIRDTLEKVKTDVFGTKIRTEKHKD